MRRLVPLVCLPVVLAWLIPAGQAQTELVRGDFFPAEFEFKELGPVKSEQTLSSPASLADVPQGTLFTEVGYRKYSRRVYALAGNNSLSIEIVRLEDSRAAYSLLTLLRRADIIAGPPGEWFSASANGVIFASGDYWVRVEEVSGPETLPKRVAVSISNRIGTQAKGVPSLVSHFPKAGYGAASLRYFLGPKSYVAYAQGIAGRHVRFESDMEVAQAQYAVQGMRGLLSLVSFPTSQIAEQFFDNAAGLDRSGDNSSKIYLKRAGPLLGILEGTFDPGTADKILGSLQFTYAIKWIYDKNNRSNGKTVWGVPMPILGTVVRSLLLTVLLCGISLFAGVGFAVFRLVLRGYAPRNYLDRPERTEIIRLKINEN